MSSSPGGDGAAVQAHPQPQHRVGEAVALLPRHDQVHVLEPREIVLRRSGRAAQPQRDLGQRERLFLRQHVEDGLERAVAARAMQAQLVAEAAALRELCARREQRGQRADRIGGAARRHARSRFRRWRARRPDGRRRAPGPAARARRARARVLFHSGTSVPRVGVRRRAASRGSSAALSGATWMISNCDGASRSSRCARAA